MLSLHIFYIKKDAQTNLMVLYIEVHGQFLQTHMRFYFIVLDLANRV